MNLSVIQKSMSQPVFLDGALWVAIGVCGALQITFKSDDAFKYVGATTLFWVKVCLDACFAGATSLKMFRSTAFAKHVQDVAKDAGKVDPLVTPTST